MIPPIAQITTYGLPMLAARWIPAVLWLQHNACCIDYIIIERTRTVPRALCTRDNSRIRALFSDEPPIYDIEPATALSRVGCSGRVKTCTLFRVGWSVGGHGKTARVKNWGSVRAKTRAFFAVGVTRHIKTLTACVRGCAHGKTQSLCGGR